MNVRYLAFHKPYGVMCRFSDPHGRPTLKELVDVPRVYPLGRLDLDSEGLLLLSDDARFQNWLLRPGSHWKTYRAQVERIPGPAELKRLETGVELDGRLTLPAKACLLEGFEPPGRSVPIRYRKNVPTAWIELSLTEGRNRQVRRMTAAVGHPTLRLIRVRVGKIELGDLSPGQWRDFTPAELRWAQF
ncbi:pseudouridine synthase [bacterium CPR1]|nr:pseudouridine synthase [bacterium CPR1]